MITAQVETLAEVLEDLKPFFHGHWEELALNKDKVPLDPDYPQYLAREAAGGVVLVTLRSDGAIVGYFVGFVAPHIHYKSCLTCTMDIFYIQPEFRGRMGGVRLFKRVEQELKRRGVQRAFFGSKLHKDSGRLFEALGYSAVETYYSKWLGD